MPCRMNFRAFTTVWKDDRTWRTDGTWKRMHTALREQVRLKAGRQPTKSAAISDSQVVQTTQKGGPAETSVANRSKAASATCKKEGFDTWVKATLGWEVEIVEHRLLWPARRVGTRRGHGGLGADPPQGVSGAQTTMGGGANLCLVVHLAPTFQRLRSA